MTFEVILPKGTGELLGNALRRIAMTSIPAWRPIAFGFEGMQMNMLHIDSLIVEDTPAVLSNLSDLEIKPARVVAGPYKVMKFVFSGELRASDMSNEDFVFENKSDYPIVSAVDRNKTVSLNVIFKLASGGFTSKENQSLTSEDVGIPLEGFVFLGSRHAEVDKFTYDVVDTSIREEKLTLDLSSKSKNNTEILLSSVQSLENLLGLFKKNLEESLI